ncbi:MAG: prolipoprotein diacylglyceryl transferase [Dehalococcoidia bacterium]|nr:prolipoprotein diacylglyceryl transferase [Dehalococcoidia bacterium]
MGPIEIGIDPVIFHIGHFGLRWYSLAILAALAAGIALTLREARHKGIHEDVIWGVAVWGVIGGLIGARLFHVIDNLDKYLADPLSILAVQEGGLAISGAIVVGLLAAFIQARRQGWPFLRVLDAAAPGLILGQAIGHIGCIIQGDSLGPATDLPWGFVYTNPGAMAPALGVPFLPSQAYEMVWDLAIFAFLWFMRKRVHNDGLLFAAYMFLYSINKFTVSFWRENVLLAFGLREAQLVALALLASSVVGFLILYRRQNLTAAIQPEAAHQGERVKQ